MGLLGGNGKEIKPEEQKKAEQQINEPKTIISVSLFPDGHTELKSQMQSPMVVYILMQMVINMCSGKNQENKVIPARGRMMNFARKVFGR